MELILILLAIAALCYIMLRICSSSLNRSVEKIRNNTASSVKDIACKLDEIGFITTSEIATHYLLEVKSAPVKQVKVDSQSKRVAICDYEADELICLNFNDILDCVLMEDHNVVCDSGVGRAVIGAAIAGDVGAIVASNTAKGKDIVHSLSIRITTSDVDHPQIVLETLMGNKNRSDVEYRPLLEHARKIYAIFNSIILSNRALTGQQ